MIHEIQVKNYAVEPQVIDVGTKGSYGNEQLKFSFTNEWQGLLVKVSFFPPNIKPVVLLLHDGGLIDIPSEVTRNGGKTQYIVSGHADGRLIKSLVGELNVFNTLNVATTPPNSPTPTEMEQVEQWLLEAIALAQSVRDDADNGVFDGEDGVTPVFSVGEVTKGEEPQLSITGTAANPVLNAVLPKGDTGATGEKGEKGDKGDKGDPGDKGDKGDKGDAGKGFAVLGYYDTLNDLQANVETPNAGDVYGVGTVAPYDTYIWDGVNGEWVNNGTIQGAKGDKGDDGYSPTATVTKVDGTVTISIADKNGNTTETVKDGKDGQDGVDGATGDKGDKGDKGDTGNVMYATFSFNPSTGNLIMHTPDEYSGAMFNINDDGEMVVEIGGV